MLFGKEKKKIPNPDIVKIESHFSVLAMASFNETNAIHIEKADAFILVASTYYANVVFRYNDALCERYVYGIIVQGQLIIMYVKKEVEVDVQ